MWRNDNNDSHDTDHYREIPLQSDCVAENETHGRRACAFSRISTNDATQILNASPVFSRFLSNIYSTEIKNSNRQPIAPAINSWAKTNWLLHPRARVCARASVCVDVDNGRAWCQRVIARDDSAVFFFFFFISFSFHCSVEVLLLLQVWHATCVERAHTKRPALCTLPIRQFGTGKRERLM